MLEGFFLTVNEWIAGGTAIAALGCFFWGMISVLFSPCHLASIPLIIGYVAGQENMVSGKHAARYAVLFTVGLFISIALIGIICALLGRMLGEVGPYWTILVGAILIWVALDMLGVQACSMSGTALSRFTLRGYWGSFILGLAYGTLSGSCTFGFIAPILAFITVQQEILIGLACIVLFGIGHCVPIVIAGSSAALVKRAVENRALQQGSIWFRRLAGTAIGLFGVYFIIRPFLGT